MRQNSILIKTFFSPFFFRNDFENYRYDDFIVFDTAKCFRNEIPLHFDVLTETIQNCCLVARDVSLLLNSKIGY